MTQFGLQILPIILTNFSICDSNTRHPSKCWVNSEVSDRPMRRRNLNLVSLNRKGSALTGAATVRRASDVIIHQTRPDQTAPQTDGPRNRGREGGKIAAVDQTTLRPRKGERKGEVIVLATPAPARPTARRSFIKGTCWGDGHLPPQMFLMSFQG